MKQGRWTLTRIFGLEHLTLAEDVVQATLARALQTWPFSGVPKNPAAWIMRASRNVALDVVRREKVFRDKEGEIARLIEGGLTWSLSASDERYPSRSSRPISVMGRSARGPR
jgi:RNA polymerase sigma-70 factor (ECF subfamily)